MDRLYYVYALIDPTRSDTVFYIGKGKGNRALTSSRYTANNPIKQARLNKIRTKGFEPVIRIIRQFLTEIEALDLEKQFVTFFGRICDQTGCLSNLTWGGDGTSGYRHTELDRKRMSDIQKAIIVRDGARLHSEKHKQKLREDNAGGKATAKPIFQIDTNGVVVKVWRSANAAAIALDSNKGNICSCASKNKHRIVSGYYWRFVGDQDVVDGRLVNIEAMNKRRALRGGAITISKISLTGEIIASYESVKEAAAHHPNLKYATIWAAEKYNRPCGGYYWRKSNQFSDESSSSSS